MESATPLITLRAGGSKLNQRLYAELRHQISDGRWVAGTRIPSSRTLANDLQVSRNTALWALDQLVADGLITARSGSGMFVTGTPATDRRVRPEPSTGPQCFEIEPGAIDKFPVRTWRAMTARIWQDHGVGVLQPTNSLGEAALREAIASRVCPARGLSVSPDQIIIAAGRSAAIEMICDAITDIGDRAILEDPSSLQFAHIMRRSGLFVDHAPVDPHGIVFGEAFRDASVKFALVAPVSQFPTGARMSARRRRALCEWAHTSRWIVEFDCASRLGGDDLDLPIAAGKYGQRSIVIETLDRALGSETGVAFIVVPEGLVPRFADKSFEAHLRPSRLTQLITAEFIKSGSFARHVRMLRRVEAQRRSEMIDRVTPIIEKHFAILDMPSAPHLILAPRGAGGDFSIDQIVERGPTIARLSDFAVRAVSDRALIGFAAFGSDQIELGVDQLRHAIMN